MLRTLSFCRLIAEFVLKTVVIPVESVETIFPRSANHESDFVAPSAISP